MASMLHFLLRHGYLVLLLWVFLEQVGAPLPATPLLLAAGALAGQGRLSFAGVLALAVCGSLAADSLWYTLGRLRGASVLTRLCQISLEPDSCVREAEDRMGRHTSFSLVVGKFVPGLSLAAPPIAGMVRMNIKRFIGLSFAAAALWASVYTGLGYVFSHELARIADDALRLGTVLLALLVLAFAGYLAAKYRQRRRLLRRLRVERIEPAELKARLDGNEPVAIVDLRHGLDFASDPYTLPGAIHLEPEELDRRHGEIPRGREVILYCS
jgi:membrane protein DedA with SNARE-associated domain